MPMTKSFDRHRVKGTSKTTRTYVTIHTSLTISKQEIQLGTGCWIDRLAENEQKKKK